MSSEDDKNSDADLFGSEDEEEPQPPVSDDRAPSPGIVDDDDGDARYDSEEDVKGRPRAIESEEEGDSGRDTGVKDLEAVDDNLFGSGDEDAEEHPGKEGLEDEPIERTRRRSQTRSPSPGQHRLSPMSDDEDDSLVRKVDEKIIPELRPPISSDGKHYLAKIPNFLNVDPIPFDPETYVNPVDGNIQNRDPQDKIRIAVESTIRWRIVRDEETGGAKKVSNARIIRWDDGTMSLLVGQELFDIMQNDINDQQQYLLAHQKSGGILESHLKLTHSMAFKPADIKGVTHKNLTAVIADKHTKKVRTKMYVTEKDPEIMKHEAEHAESERLRTQRKLESTRRRGALRYSQGGLTEARLEVEEYSGDEDLGGSSSRHRRDVYEGDFVVDDDDIIEEERERERIDRINRAKKTGMDKYKRRRNESEEEEMQEEGEEEGGEEDAGEDEDDQIVARKAKRRQVVSDDED